MLRKIGLTIIALLVIAFAGLAIAPPEQLRVAANYAAKMICSNVVLADRDPAEVLKVDVQAPGHPLLWLMRFAVDERGDYTVVRTGLFGFIGKGISFGNRSRGCTSVSDPRLLSIASAAPAYAPAQIQLPDAPWPEGNNVVPPINLELEAVLNDAQLSGEGMRAIVIAKDGRIIAERYAEGFDQDTPLLGWSMTKTVTGALVGAAVHQGYLALDDQVAFDEWADDGRSAIRLYDLMGMASDLTWNEGYGSVSDVTRMLYLEQSMANFAASKPIDRQTPEPTGDSFLYSSGTSVLIARILQDAIGDEALAGAFPARSLFAPIGMSSAVLETDATGTFVGSSYLYATPRDWARFGQFLLQRGVWNGRSLLPPGYVDWMTDPHPASNGTYGRGHVWLRPPQEPAVASQTELPAGTFWASGHDGQSLAVIPAENMVIVRLGLTPSKLGYRPALLAQAVIRAVQ
ncbi:MAG: beta-lactamase family protein [Altererythrobacter sp.]|nr:beta-lactamase family protein [Altererythrobacter sp.]